MKKLILSVIVLVGMSSTVCFGQEKKAEAKKLGVKEAGNTYFVQTSHTKEECLAAIDDAKAKGLLGKVQFGCNYGDHTGYAFLHGKDEAAVTQKIPENLRAKSKVQRVEKFTSEQVASFHK